ncbi:MAG: desaturase [Myxococcaceae bacterium]|nr:desaturase [Myxococcaceae bacterium]
MTPPTRVKIAAGPSRHIYDVIVLGGQLGGPLAGALLQKRGYRVLLIEHDGLGHGYDHGGYTLPWAPFVAPSLKAMPVVEEVLHELGLNTTIQRALRPHHPGLQLVLPRHRVDLHADPAKRRAELVREFGEDGAKVDDALSRFCTHHEQSNAFIQKVQDLPPTGLLGGWSARREIAKYPEIEALPALDGATPATQLLGRMLPFVTWLENTDAPLARTRPLSQVLHTPNRYPGGREGLRELLVKKLQDLGGHVLSRDTSDAWVVEQLVFDGDRLKGVQVLQSNNEYASSAVVAATDAGALRRLVPDKKRHRALVEMLDGVSTRRFLYAVNWVVPTEALPRGMGELLLLDTQDDLEALLIQVHGARKSSGEEDTQSRVVCAGAFVPASVRDLGEPKLEALRKQIEGHLDALMPFARSRAVLSSAPYLDADSVRGSRLLPHPLLDVDAERYAGVSGLSPKTPLKNLFVASREVLPGLGLEGELMAGVRAARLVHELLNKSKPIRR